jgi:hypothetical protein
MINLQMKNIKDLNDGGKMDMTFQIQGMKSGWKYKSLMEQMMMMMMQFLRYILKQYNLLNTKVL